MQIKDYDTRVKELAFYAKELGVSLTRTVEASTGKTDENIVCERINQALMIHQGNKMWMVALCSAIASIISAIAAWVAILK